LTATHGFTLIELVVTLSLITLMLFVTIPRLPNTSFTDGKRRTSTWITGKIQALKDKSVIRDRDHTLHIDMETGRLWISHESMTPDELHSARLKGFVLPDGARVQGVEFSDGEKQTSGQAEILFSKKGYSGKALIHTSFSDGTRRSFLVEPFLQKVKLYEGPISFNQ